MTSSFHFFINSTYVGRFVSPLPSSSLCPFYFCSSCGEKFAYRTNESGINHWYAIPGTCLSCRGTSSPPAEFILPGERSRGFEPIELLSWELLFNMQGYLQ